MGHNDELRLVIDKLVDRHQRGKLSIWGQRRFWLIQKVKAIPAELLGQERQERFAMGLVMEGLPAIAAEISDFVHVGGNVVEALRPKEIMVLGGLGPSRDVEAGVEG